MKEEIKQTLIKGIENREFTSSFSDDLFDNVDQISEYLEKQELLMNRDVVLVKKHYIGETKILTDTYYACKKSDVDDSIKKVMDTKDRYKKELQDSKAYVELQKEEIARQITMRKYAKQRGALLFFIGLIGGILGVYLMSLIF